MNMLKRQWMQMLIVVLLIMTSKTIAQDEPDGIPLNEPRIDNEAPAAESFESEGGFDSDSKLNTEDFKTDAEGAVVLGIGQRYRIKKNKPVVSIKTGGQGGIQVSQDSKGVMEVTGDSVGKANLHISFADKSSHTHSFVVESESHDFEAIIKKLFPKAELEIVPIRDSAIFLRGSVESDAEVQQIEEIAEEFWPSVHNHIRPKKTGDLGFNGYGRAVTQPFRTPRYRTPQADIEQPNPYRPISPETPLGLPNAYPTPVESLPGPGVRGETKKRTESSPSQFTSPMQTPVNPRVNSNSNGINSIRNDVRKLHSDVQKLIEILETRKKQEADEDEIENDVSLIPQKGSSIAFFTAAWSAPDQKMKPIVKKLQGEGFQIVSVDLDRHPQLVRKMNVTKVPTFVKLVDGIEFHPAGTETRKSGLMSEEELRKFISPSRIENPLPVY